MAEIVLIESNLNSFFSDGCLITGDWGPILAEIALDIGFVTNLDESTGYLVTVSGYIGQADDVNDYETYPRYISDNTDNLGISFSDLGWEVAYGPDLSYPYDSWIVENMHQEDFSSDAKISLIKIVPDTPNEISKIKLFNTLYSIKDVIARQQISDLPKPMIFKGSLGTGGTISSLPSASIQTIGHTYKVITDGYYEGIQAKIGDMFICNDTPEWTLIPSGDDAGGTVTNIATGAGLSGGPITTSGTIFVDFNSVQSKLVSGTDIKTINNTSLLGSGNLSTYYIVDTTTIRVETPPYTNSWHKEVVASINNNVPLILKLPGEDVPHYHPVLKYEVTIEILPSPFTVIDKINFYILTGENEVSIYTLSVDPTTLSETSREYKCVLTSSCSFQDVLISGTNIKTINNTSLLGSGNIDVQGVLTAGENIIIDANNEISVDMAPITNEYIDSLFS